MMPRSVAPRSSPSLVMVPLYDCVGPGADGVKLQLSASRDPTMTPSSIEVLHTRVPACTRSSATAELPASMSIDAIEKNAAYERFMRPSPAGTAFPAWYLLSFLVQAQKNNAVRS